MHHLIEVWFHWVLTGGYAAVFWLMALESTIIPIPSEVVIPPAAIVAATQQGSGMSLVGVVIAGTLGSWFGSAIMYWVARWLGRPAILRWGKYVFVPPEKLARAEVFLRRYEAGGIFFARLLPVIRHLISIPAGMMPAAMILLTHSPAFSADAKPTSTARARSGFFRIRTVISVTTPNSPSDPVMTPSRS